MESTQPNKGVTISQNQNNFKMSDACGSITYENPSTIVDRPKKVKGPPSSCFDSEECSSSDELSRICFSNASSLPVVEVSCSSNDSVMSSGSEVSVIEIPRVILNGVDLDGEKDMLCSYRQDGTCMQMRRLSESRQGRDNQRWDKDESSWIRLTTGVVPITNDGRIVFVSSARKKEWILPKGGWESDETMEDSALRETYEEAGLLGFLGPKLTEVSFETRKAKERRLKLEDSQNVSSFKLQESDVATFSAPVLSCKFDNCDSPPRIIVSEKEEPIPRNGMCRMTLFPLYITKVLDTWPESGRSRKVCTLDEAIEIARPEFKSVFIEIKEKRLHLLT